MQSPAFVSSLRSAPFFAHAVAIATVAVWVIKAAWLDFVEVDSHLLVGLGHVVDGLLSAIIAGYVFYIIFAVYPDYRQRLIMAPFLFERMRSIVGDCLAVIETIESVSQLPVAFRSATEAEVDRAFAATKTSVPPPAIVGIGGQPMTWPGFFIFRYERTVEAIDDLFKQSRFLDADLISLLTSIRSAPFYRMSVALGPLPIGNENLEAWSPSFGRLLELCRRLADWHDQHRMPGIEPFLSTIKN